MGYVKIHLSEIAYEAFSDMSYFSKWIPPGCELVQVQLCYEPGYWDSDPDEAYISVEWKEVEKNDS